MTEPASQYFYPNKMGWIILQAIEEILGHNGLNAVLNQSRLSHLINNYPPNNLERQFPFQNISAINAALEELYGPRGGQGMAIRCGRVSFKYILRELGPEIGLSDPAFRLLPPHTKIREGLTLLANAFNQSSDQSVRVEETEANFLWHIEPCPICWGRHSDAPVCHATVGMLQEALYWVSGGKFFNVEESLCVARGDPACTIRIDKDPLE
jgi:predicted hydrocarbon binding protein